MWCEIGHNCIIIKDVLKYLFMILLIDPSGSNPHRCSPPYMNLKVNKLNYCNFFYFVWFVWVVGNVKQRKKILLQM
jgi:hypothetical protein